MRLALYRRHANTNLCRYSYLVHFGPRRPLLGDHSSKPVLPREGAAAHRRGAEPTYLCGLPTASLSRARARSSRRLVRRLPRDPGGGHAGRLRALRCRHHGWAAPSPWLALSRLCGGAPTVSPRRRCVALWWGATRRDHRLEEPPRISPLAAADGPTSDGAIKQPRRPRGGNRSYRPGADDEGPARAPRFQSSGDAGRGNPAAAAGD